MPDVNGVLALGAVIYKLLFLGTMYAPYVDPDGVNDIKSFTGSNLTVPPYTPFDVDVTTPSIVAPDAYKAPPIVTLNAFDALAGFG